MEINKKKYVFARSTLLSHFKVLFFINMRVCIFLIVVFTYFMQNGCANEPTVVHTNYGDVLGYQTDLARVFYGIPFAQPPVEKLR
jgi:hypothetical protein